MEKRISSRAVIIENGKVLTMFRRKTKNGITEEYYVVPGGGIEAGETLEENVKRELSEELNVEIEIIGYLGTIEYDTNIANFFHCNIINGKPKLGGEELDRMTDDNYYEVRFVDINKLDEIEFSAKEKVYQALNEEYEKIV